MEFWIGAEPIGLIVPVIVSPTWKVPEIIAISKSFGTQYLVTSTPSKKPYNWVLGLTLFATNWTFRDLIKVIRSLLTNLSPWEVWSSCSVTRILVPVLSWPSSLLKVSRVPCCRLIILKPWPLRIVLSRTWVFWEINVVPPHTVSQEFHTVAANPDWRSTSNSLLALASSAAKFPSTFIIFASNLWVSSQLSEAGVSSTDPNQ